MSDAGTPLPQHDSLGSPGQRPTDDAVRNPIRVAAVLLWSALLLTVTHLPPDHSLMRQLPDYPQGDKVVHGTLYGILGLLVWYGRRGRGRELALLLLLAAADEWTQPWFGRTADISDWLADGVGLTAALGLTSLFGQGGGNCRLRPYEPSRAAASRAADPDKHPAANPVVTGQPRANAD